MQFSYLLVLVFTALAIAKNEEVQSSLEGLQAFSIVPDTVEKLSIVRSLEAFSGFDFYKFSGKINEAVNVLVTADKLSFFKTLLEDNDIQYSTLIENVKEVLDEDFAARQSAYSRRRFSNTGITFDDYLRYDEIVSYLLNISDKYNLVTSLFKIGTSYERRPMYGLKISSDNKQKPSILVDAGIHAREWISPATSLYLINQLVENSTNADLYKNVNWYIIPLLNPDGYEYTHTTNRLWRKSRSPNDGPSDCWGTDLNRNFDFHWLTVGASKDPCSETYAGFKAASEIETENLRDFVLARRGQFKLYITLHSYGQYLLYPWGYTSELPENVDTLHALAESVNEAISSYRGTHYTIGSSTNVLYAAAGGSDDWVKAVGGVDLSYTIELSGGGKFGFDLPPSQIKTVVREIFEGLKVYGKYIESTYAKEK